MPKANRGVEVLGTLALIPPKLENFQHVKVRVEGEVAWLTLDRPDHNLLNERMLSELATGISALGDQSAIKLIVLDSAGKTFCGGIELGEYTQRRVFQLLDAFHAAFSAMLDTSKPLLVVVNGPAFGGGAELAALGDLVIATPRARFAQPEIKLGVFPPLSAAILPYILGPKLALELVLTGETISAERALEIGLVNWLVPEKRIAEQGKRSDRQSDGAIGACAVHGKKSRHCQPGIAPARRRPQFDEGFPQRTRRPRRLARGPARARRKARPEVEEPLTPSAIFFELLDALEHFRP